MARERMAGTESVFFGADPEFFLEYKGKPTPIEEISKVVGREKIYYTKNDDGETFQDGTALELLINPTTCRQIFSSVFRRIIKPITKIEDVKLSTKNHLKLTNKQLKELSFDSLNFGCAASRDAWNNGEQKYMSVNPFSYKHRFAGGHLHLGVIKHRSELKICGKRPFVKEVLNNKIKLVRLLDYVVGNLSVLLDKDSDNKLRRETYGQAGEYRDKFYGVEYRVLSNFWLRNYTLSSLILGLSRACVDMVGTHKKYGYDDEILSQIPKEDVIKAINENNRELAMKNFNKIRPILEEIIRDINYIPDGYQSAYFDAIEKVIPNIYKHLPKNIHKYWKNWSGYDSTPGWETFAEKMKHEKRC